jgi:hypothetical protein
VAVSERKEVKKETRLVKKLEKGNHVIAEVKRRKERIRL